MPIFVLELYRPGLDRAGGARLTRSIRRALTDTHDDAIRYASSTLAPGDEVCYIRLEAPTRSDVDRFVERLAIEDARVSEVVDL